MEKVSEQQGMMNAERARVVDDMCLTWRHDFGLDKRVGELASCGMTDGERDALRLQMGKIYDHHIAPLVQARASQPVGVPDASDLQRVIYSADAAAKRMLEAYSFWWSEIAAIRVEFERFMRAMRVASPTFKAEQALCSEERPCIPCFTDNSECEAPSSQLAAGSTVEEVEVVAWRSRMIDPPQDNPAWQLDRWEDPKPWIENEPLMTVAQHERIVAALSAHQSAPERASVPKLAGLKSVNHQLGIVALRFNNSEQTQEAVRELRALLASAGQEV